MSTYTEQQLADLYERAVSAEAAGEHSTDAGYELDNAMLALAPNYGGLIRTLIDQLRDANRKAEPAMGPDGMEHFTVKLPEGLARSTQYLIVDTAQALGNKLLAAQNKRKADPVGWMRHDWEDDCRAGLMHHIQKGDPRDVMAYAAFMHYHGWKTSQPDTSPDAKEFDFDALAGRFCRWPVPDNEYQDGTTNRTGTNLLTHAAAKEMLRYVLKDTQPINTGLSWHDYKGISDRADVHEAIQNLMGDTTEDNAICLIRAIAEALRPRPRFWVDVHGYQTYLLWSEEDAVKHCNETGGLYVLPLFAGEPINCKLPEVMCRLAPESDVVEVNRLISNLKALPQKYTTSHIALEDVLEVINQLRTAK